MAIVAVIIANEQFAVTQCAVLVEYAIVQNNIANYTFFSSQLVDFCFRSNYFTVFIYREFVACCIECASAVYEERHDSVFCRSTYGQVVFGIQCIGLNGVCIYIAVFIYGELVVCTVECAGAVYEERHNSVVCCSTYGQVVFGIQCIGLNGVCIYIAVFIYGELVVCTVECASAVYEERHDTVFSHSTYRHIVFRVQGVGLNGVCIYIRCRSSHRRSHACTGHNTCCNQHCQQLFGRATFAAMILRDFGDNNVCVARFAPNYFKNFVHKNSSHINIIIYILYVPPATYGNKLNNYCIIIHALMLPFANIRFSEAAPGNKPSQNSLKYT